MAVEESGVIKRQMKKQRQGDEHDYRTQRNGGNSWWSAGIIKLNTNSTSAGDAKTNINFTPIG